MKPKVGKYAIETNPMLEKVFFGLFKMINESCL